MKGWANRWQEGRGQRGGSWLSKQRWVEVTGVWSGPSDERAKRLARYLLGWSWEMAGLLL